MFLRPGAVVFGSGFYNVDASCCYCLMFSVDFRRHISDLAIFLRGGRWHASAVWLVLCLLTSSAIATPFAGGVIRSYAYARYTQPNAIERTAYSNSVHAVVQVVEAFFLTPDQTSVGQADTTVEFRHVLTNTGNAPSGYRFYLDKNGCAEALPSMHGSRLYWRSGRIRSGNHLERACCHAPAAR